MISLPSSNTLRVPESTWSIRPVRTFCGSFETSLNGPGVSVSLFNVSGASRSSGVPSATILDFLDAKTSAPAWPTTKPVQSSREPKAFVNGRSGVKNGTSLLVKSNGQQTNGSHTRRGEFRYHAAHECGPSYRF